jgi:rod shape-determining protein MreC
MTPGRSQTRSLVLLAASLGIQILLLAAQVKRDQDVRLIRVWAVEIVAPLGRSAAWLVDGVRGGWTNYIGFRGLGRENEQLRAEIDRLKLRNIELEGRAAEADRLSGLLEFRQRNSQVPMLSARVIGASPSNSGRVAFLDRGAGDGVALNMGVITPEGVVGKVIAVYPATSQVLLVSDKESGVGALLANTRTQGPIRGSGDPLLGMEYVAREVKVTPGEVVVTSGQDRIFPKDLPVGIVQDVSPDAHSPFQKIVVKPSARLDQLEEVLILLTRQELAPVGVVEARAGIASGTASTSKTASVSPTSPVTRPGATTTVSVPVPLKPPPATASPATSAAKPPVVAPAQTPVTSRPPAPATDPAPPAASQPNTPAPAEGGER